MTHTRRNTTLRILLAASLALVCGILPAAMGEGGANGALDGRVFVVERGKEGESAEYWARSFVAGAEEKTAGPGGPTKASNLLDGKTYFVQTGEKGKEADHDDYLVFWDGIFVSSGCVEIDFRKSVYTATREKDGIRFHAETVSPTHGTMIWDGIVWGDVVDATARWIHKRWYWTIDREYWYRGRLYE